MNEERNDRGGTRKRRFVSLGRALKEHKGRLYIIQRCLLMLLCSHD
ncbi:uncharacterized protein LOC109842389 [Asparagus officinalis]|nr:uncharacterized protein LOC109842389 [Asparagus officinalis]